MTTLAAFVMTEDAFHRDVVRGVTAHAFEQGWQVRLCQDGLRVPAADLARLVRRHPGDVLVIQGLDHPPLTAAFLASGRPLVAVTARPPGFAGPVVAVDQVAVGRHAARHLLDRGFRTCAFVGWRDAAWSVQRLTGFHETLTEAGRPPATFFLNRASLALVGATPEDWYHAAARWLRGLAAPLAVLAHNDAVAADLARLCQAHGLRVPEDVAVLGIADDVFTCETVQPPLSSVRLPGIAIGLEAARLAGRLLAGEPVAGDTQLPPLGVALRRSTDIVAVADPALAAALRLIRERWREGLAPAAIAAAVGLSRRTLERRFRRHFGRSPQAEIRRLRLERARQLLIDTSRSVADVARDCGFADASAFTRVFRQIVGESPSALRARAHGATAREA